MEKFTKYQKRDNSIQPEVKYDGYINIISYKDYEIAKESDCVIILPYMISNDSILLRREPVPTYELSFPEAKTDKFLTVISGTMEEGESPEQTIRRELYEEAGIILSSVKSIEVSDPVCMSKGNMAKYHCCFIDISDGEYKQTYAPGDGTESEKNSQTIKIKIDDIDQLKTYDLITEYMLTKFKSLKNISEK